MGTYHAGHFLHRFQAAAHGPDTPVVEKGSRPEQGSVVPQMLKRLLQVPSPCRRQFADQQRLQFLPSPPTYPTATAQQRPAHVLESLRRCPALGPQPCALPPAYLVHRLVQMHRDMAALEHMQSLT